MQNGYATSRRSRISAGVTNSGPRSSSRSSHSRIRILKRGRPDAEVTRVLPMAMELASPGQDLLHLVFGPRDGVLGRRAGDRLGKHVGHDEGVGDELDLVTRGGGPAVAVELHAFLLEGGELGVGLEH